MYGLWFRAYVLKSKQVHHLHGVHYISNLFDTAAAVADDLPEQLQQP